MARPWQGVIGRSFTRDEFPIYLREEVQFTQWRPQFVVVHNTAAPTLVQWHSTPGAKRMRNLEHFYKNERRWSAGPHLFVADDLIWVFTPLTTHGVHSPSFNSKSWGVEIVGDYNHEAFVGEVRTNTIAALAALHEFAGLDPETMRWHREDPRTTHDCPGANIGKDEVIRAVIEAMDDEGDHDPGVGSSNDSDDTVELPQLLRSPLLASVPFLENVAVGRFVLARGKTQPRDATGAIQDGLNSLNQPDFSINLGPQNRHRGIYGPGTERAVTAFQRAHELDDDGRVGKDTISKLDQVLLD